MAHVPEAPLHELPNGRRPSPRLPQPSYPRHMNASDSSKDPNTTRQYPPLWNKQLVGGNSAWRGARGGYELWRSAAEITVFVRGLPQGVSTIDIWRWFSREGELSFIDIFTDDHSRGRPRRGVIRFSPPPAQPFWESLDGRYDVPVSDNRTTRLRLELAERNSESYQASPESRRYPRKLLVKATALGFGFFTDPGKVKLMRSCSPIPEIPIILEHDLKFHEISVTVPIPIGADQYYHYRLAFSQANPMRVWRVPTSHGSPRHVSLVFALDVVPEFSVRCDDEASHVPDSRTWAARNAWHRIADILPQGQHFGAQSTSLRKTESLVDLGRWRVYCLDFDLENQPVRDAFATFCSSVEDYNTKFDNTLLSFDDRSLTPIWDYLDGSSRGGQTSSSVLAELQSQPALHLPFSVRYQLEVCFSENFLNEHTLSRDFIDKLANMEEKQALMLLESIHNDSKPVYYPMSLYESAGYLHKSHKSKVPHYCMHIRSAIVTPTTVHYTPTTIEISNRVLRRYSQYSERFLRVRFGAERHRGRLYTAEKYANGKSPMDNIYKRIENTLRFGIDIGNRHYDFLAFGNSQFRENGAYFFASTSHITVSDIRKWMGDFNHIRSVSKYAARLGQCFSTTRPIHGVRGKLIRTTDIRSADGRYNFTDGVGRISKSLAQIAAGETGVLDADNEFPSVMQFRLAGCKGVLAIHHEPGLNIHMRESQEKFQAQYEGLEVIRWSNFCSAHLNRQFIAVLSALGVPSYIFMKKAKAQIADLDAAMNDKQIALTCLQKEVDPNQMNTVIARIVREGFHDSQEMFLMNVLRLWRAAAMRQLKESARIPIVKGACLLGCVDEFGVLSGHFDASTPTSYGKWAAPRKDPVPEVFLQVSKGATGGPEVITGYMLLTRSPSLHPGDIRVVRGVDRPALRHLKDVVVLPQTGDRDLGSMCGGGDLDGDEYVAMWDEDLLPEEWNLQPMDYTAPAESRKPTDVTINDVVSFFVDYMRNDSLGKIARSHLAQADKSPLGVRDPKCIELAMLHSCAVDYPKSGRPAEMDPRLRPRDWPHYLVPEGSTRRVYHSTTVLGQLFDMVGQLDFAPLYHGGFDQSILQRYEHGSEILATARELKQRYDASMSRVMAQYDIKTDLEIWSTFAFQHNKRVTDFKMHEELGRHACSIKDTFREQCFEAAGGRQFELMGPFVAAMYTVTFNELHTRLGIDAGAADSISSELKLPAVMISFPWLFPEVLIRLSNDRGAGVHCPGEEVLRLDMVRVKRASETPITKETLRVEEDILETEEGEMHHGDELILFGADEDEADSPAEMMGVDKRPQTTLVEPSSSLLDRLANL